uniref:Uncharacterized protein n=1 Tax=Romanomermis culicivorax TaxID=13658 RepID=A0A915IDR1_ROMCU
SSFFHKCRGKSRLPRKKVSSGRHVPGLTISEAAKTVIFSKTETVKLKIVKPEPKLKFLGKQKVMFMKAENSKGPQNDFVKIV